MNLHNLSALRRYLHQNPELSGQEFRTSHFIAQMLSKCNPDMLKTMVGGTGVVAVFNGKAKGPNILFRCELDALPIQESNTDLSYTSQIPNVSHKCGHDGHMAILLGLAHKLTDHPLSKGRITLLFQPAEETGTGAKAVALDPFFQTLHHDFAFALHNLPGYPLGQVILKEGTITAAVKSIIIRLKGKEAHAAEPENGINPASAIKAILDLQEKSNLPDVNNPAFYLITPIYIQMGEQAYGVSAGDGEIHFTLRAWDQPTMDRKTDLFVFHLQAIAEQHQLQLDIDWTDEFKANVNSTLGTKVVRAACFNNQLQTVHRNYPLKWGEDFGYLLQKHEGAFIGLGSGFDCPALHHANYDFPDDLIKIGVDLFAGIIDQIQSLS